MVWLAIDRLSIIWKSDLSDKIKCNFFQTAVVSILLYVCSTWMLTKRIEKTLDGIAQEYYDLYCKNPGSYIPQNSSCTGTDLPISKTIQINRTIHGGHCWRSIDKLIGDVFLWTLSHKRACVGRPTRTYLQQLCTDTGCSLEDLPEAMNDRDEWREGDREKD